MRASSSAVAFHLPIASAPRAAPGRHLDLDGHAPGSASPAEIIIAAGRTSPKYLRSIGQHSGNPRVGQHVGDAHHVA